MFGPMGSSSIKVNSTEILISPTPWRLRSSEVAAIRDCYGLSEGVPFSSTPTSGAARYCGDESIVARFEHNLEHNISAPISSSMRVSFSSCVVGSEETSPLWG